MAHEYKRPYNPDGVQAYLLSFRCYGTWLHGDSRSSVSRAGHNRWSTPKLPPDRKREERERDALKHAPVAFGSAARRIVDHSIRKVCQHCGWILHALNVQRDHVHLVVTAHAKPPEEVMNSLKSWATRQLRENRLVPARGKVWSRHGSTKWLWTEDQVRHACAYVIDGQPLPPGM